MQRIRSYIKKYENSELFEILLNIYLVAHNGRDVALLEFNKDNVSGKLSKKKNLTSVLRKKTKEFVKKFFPTSIILIPDFSNIRYFAFRRDFNLEEPTTDEDIAKLLGFLCVGHDYSNRALKSHLLHINITPGPPLFNNLYALPIS